MAVPRLKAPPVSAVISISVQFPATTRLRLTVAIVPVSRWLLGEGRTWRAHFLHLAQRVGVGKLASSRCVTTQLTEANKQVLAESASILFSRPPTGHRQSSSMNRPRGLVCLSPGCSSVPGSGWKGSRPLRTSGATPIDAQSDFTSIAVLTASHRPAARPGGGRAAVWHAHS